MQGIIKAVQVPCNTQYRLSVTRRRIQVHGAEAEKKETRKRSGRSNSNKIGIMELTLEQRQIAIAMVEYLKEQGYVLSPQASEKLKEYQDKEDEYICGKEVADRLGCKPQFVTKLKNSKALKYYMKGSRPMYSVKSVNKYIEKRMIKDRTAM